MKLIDREAVVAEIGKRIKAIPIGETDKCLKALYGNEAFVLNDLLSFIGTLEVKDVYIENLQEEPELADDGDFPKEEPVNNDFEEAANNAVIALVPSFGQKYSDGSYVSSCRDSFKREELIELFKAGAKWQKERIMANSTNATIGLPYENRYGGYTHLIDVSRPLQVGNNIIAIIFNED